MSLLRLPHQQGVNVVARPSDSAMSRSPPRVCMPKAAEIPLTASQLRELKIPLRGQGLHPRGRLDIIRKLECSRPWNPCRRSAHRVREDSRANSFEGETSRQYTAGPHGTSVVPVLVVHSSCAEALSCAACEFPRTARLVARRFLVSSVGISPGTSSR